MGLRKGKYIANKTQDAPRSTKDGRVFLGDRESEARHSRLLLLRAGDIEENPGPNHCGWCKDLVKEANYLSCKNCETKFHMKRFCSGLSRNDARTTARDNTLLCFMCARREWLECALCSSKFHNSQKGNKCCDCGNSYHYKCAKVLRSQQGSKDWKCPPCKGEHLSQPQQPGAGNMCHLRRAHQEGSQQEQMRSLQQRRTHQVQRWKETRLALPNVRHEPTTATTSPTAEPRHTPHKQM